MTDPYQTLDPLVAQAAWGAIHDDIGRPAPLDPIMPRVVRLPGVVGTIVRRLASLRGQQVSGRVWTIWPRVYTTVDDLPWLTWMEEWWHTSQQRRYGVWRWMWRYLHDADFYREEERQAANESLRLAILYNYFCLAWDQDDKVITGDCRKPLPTGAKGE